MRDVAIDRVASDDLHIVPGRTSPSAFKLAAHGSRRVRLALTVSGCLPKGDGVGPRVAAKVDGRAIELPMSVALEFRGRGCPAP